MKRGSAREIKERNGIFQPFFTHILHCLPDAGAPSIFAE
jgi:hypothetical protein